MKSALSCVFAVAVIGLTGCTHSHTPPAAASMSLAEIQLRAATFNNRLTVPDFETTPDAVRQSLTHALSVADRALDDVARVRPEAATFDNTLGALDLASFHAVAVANRLNLIKETSPDAAVRDAASEAIKRFSEWSVGLEYREDVYRAIQGFADRQPALAPEPAKLLRETLRDYRRAGLALPKAERDEVERLRKQLAGLVTDFESNINKARGPVKFTRAELAGVPESFLNLEGVKTGADEFTFQANVTFQFLGIMENARSEATRRRMQEVHGTLARETNVALLRQILELRATIAQRLGYASWADYEIEPKMARTAATASAFLERLRAGLQPKLDAELATFRELKARETGDAQAAIHIWDWRYFANELKKQKFNVDAEQLRDFFPLDRTLHGMFAVYQRIFGVKFHRVEPPAKWISDLQLWGVTDARSGEPLGLFYLDLFPREGKYNHFAVFGVVDGKQLPGGPYQRPTVAMVCNFPPPQAGKPSLLSHEDVVTLFHEFGHVMHGMLTRAPFVRFSGSNVEGDFVEAPSQMLENWAWDKDILDTFAADYRDPAKKIPAQILAQLQAAELATKATWYRRQVSFGLLDLALHTQIQPGGTVDPVQLSNRILSDTLLPVMDGSAFVAYFGHLMHYDAGYYGYAWADVIAADMASVFEAAPGRYLDETVGRRLRDEIYAVGSSRDPVVSIEKFLGRPQSQQPFLKKAGIATDP
jgi:thimet oligopeptidase